MDSENEKDEGIKSDADKEEVVEAKSEKQDEHMKVGNLCFYLLIFF